MSEPIAVAQSLRWTELSTGTTASLRGLTTAQHSSTQQPVIWASGSKGTILLTLDLGKSWSAIGPRNFDELEFRSLHAWNEREAMVASAGTPAIVLKTVDAGKSWREVHRDNRPAAFFDGLKFIDQQRGVLFGDPIDGRFVVLTTRDRGESWQPIHPAVLPEVRAGEAAFAASNSAMIVAAPGSIWIGTGGAQSPQSRLLRSTDFGQSWQVSDCPFPSQPSSGIFSLALTENPRILVAVGGDYQPAAKSLATGAFSLDDGQSFVPCPQQPSGYRSAVVYSVSPTSDQGGGRFIATGPAGTDLSADGKSWRNISSVGFHALSVLPDGRVIAVGSEGRFGRLDESP